MQTLVERGCGLDVHQASILQSVFCFSITFHRLDAIRCSISD
jgi:hypothetical protein